MQEQNRLKRSTVNLSLNGDLFEIAFIISNMKSDYLVIVKSRRGGDWGKSFLCDKLFLLHPTFSPSPHTPHTLFFLANPLAQKLIALLNLRVIFQIISNPITTLLQQKVDI